MRSRFPISLLGALAGAALVLAVAAPSAVAGGSGSADVPPLRSAGPFLLSEVSAKVAGNWGTVWRSLYPRHQRVAPLAAFVRCERETGFPGPMKSLRVIRARAALVRVPGEGRPVPGASVTVAIELGSYGPRDAIAWTHTFHLAAVHGRWAWLLSPSRYRLYRDGCGSPLVI